MNLSCYSIVDADTWEIQWAQVNSEDHHC